MSTPTEASEEVFKHFNQLLERSEALYLEMVTRLDEVPPVSGVPRVAVSFSACALSLEHGNSLRVLVSVGNASSAIALMRLQFEALIRSMWLLYAATDEEVEKIGATLSDEALEETRNFPVASKMLSALSTKAPADKHQMVLGFKNGMWAHLNSFVHAGLHPIRRQTEGYPLQLIEQMVRASNAVATMSGMMAALLTGEPRIVESMRLIQREFTDCLPPLEPHA
jgi:hypothetical protein